MGNEPWMAMILSISEMSTQMPPPSSYKYRLRTQRQRSVRTGTYARIVTFKARPAGIGDDRHAILPCNIDDLDYIFCRSWIHYDAMWEPCSQSVSRTQSYRRECKK